MTSCFRAVLIGLVTVGFLLLGNDTFAEQAKLANLRILSHYWTTSVASSEHFGMETTWLTFSVADASQSRILVLKVIATIPEDGAVTPDRFTLSYRRHNGEEAHSGPGAFLFGLKKQPGDFGGASPSVLADVVVGEQPLSVSFGFTTFRFSQGQSCFGLAFPVEAGVDSVQLRIDDRPPLIYRVGKTRPYSVRFNTNRGPEFVAQVRNLLQARGYQVISAEGTLPQDWQGDVSLYYSSPAEAQADTVSRLLNDKLGLARSLVKSDQGDSDIDILIGK